VTNDLEQIDLWTGSGSAGDFDGDGDVDLDDHGQFAACFTGPDGGPVPTECAAGDFLGDDDVDCEDFALFRTVWTDPGAFPDLPECAATPVPEAAPGLRTALGSAYPNPLNPVTAISFRIGVEGPVRLKVFDARGRLVRTLVNGHRETGEHSASWDGRDDRGRAAGSGVFTYRLEAPGFAGTGKVVILR
jgi:hypothetical protein